MTLSLEQALALIEVLLKARRVKDAHILIDRVLEQVTKEPIR